MHWSPCTQICLSKPSTCEWASAHTFSSKCWHPAVCLRVSCACDEPRVAVQSHKFNTHTRTHTLKVTVQSHTFNTHTHHTHAHTQSYSPITHIQHTHTHTHPHIFNSAHTQAHTYMRKTYSGTDFLSPPSLSSSRSSTTWTSSASSAPAPSCPLRCATLTATCTEMPAPPA